MNYNSTRICSYVGYFTQAVTINFAPLLFVIFHNEFNISYAQIGTLTLLSFCVQILVDLLAFLFVDRIGFRTSAVLSQFLCAFGLFTMPIFARAFENAFWGLSLAIIIYSIGGGLIEVVINPIVASLPEIKKGNGLILLHSFYCWGQFFTVLLSTLALRVFKSEAWGFISIFWGLIPLINAFMFLKVPIKSAKLEKKSSIKEFLFNKNFLIVLVLMICAGASEMGMAQWASAFSQEALGVDKTVGDLLGPCLFALFMGIGRTIHGAGKVKNLMRHMGLNAFLCILCYITAGLCKNPYIALFGCAFCGYAISLMWPGVLSIASDKFNYKSGSAYSAIAVFGDIGCSLASFFTGFIASMPLWGSAGLKAGLISNIIYPIIFIVFLLKIIRAK